MNMDSSRKGSALLVVLGMLAFMVVSAVAFSAYMRYSRLPSSFLRRTTASRELVKAALARAIDEIDAAIGDNPHPGSGTKYYELDGNGGLAWRNNAYVTGDGADRSKNYWYNHVYIGTNHLQQSFSDTAPVMTLEGLAYIPPPYVDAARYYGRLSSAAQWKSFDFDAGRYAFCAIDMSDCFDINRLSASLPRSSAGNGRVSLSYLFEKGDHSNPDSGGGSQWDEMMSNYRQEEDDGSFSYDNDIPLVSLADMNMAIGGTSYGNLYSPWYKYVESGKADAFYGGKEAYAKLMAFSTDSWFPTTNTASNAAGDYDLANPEYQPFDPNDLMTEGKLPPGVTDIGSRPGASRLLESMCGIGMYSLWDYLDTDSMPMSLALPVLERNPMIVGLEAKLGEGAALKINRSNIEDIAEPVIDGNQKTRTSRIKYTVDGGELAKLFAGGGVQALVTYPFCRDDGQKKGNSWTTEGYVIMYFTDFNNDIGLRTKNSGDVINFNAIKGKQGLVDNCVLVVPFGDGETLSFDNVDSEEKAVVATARPAFKGGVQSAIATSVNNAPLLTLDFEWTQTSDEDGNWTPESPDMTSGHGIVVKDAICGWLPLKADGTKMSQDDVVGKIKNGSPNDATVLLSLNLAVTMAIKDKNKYVDLVPACLDDDKDLNGKNTAAPFGPMKNKIGAAHPVMKMGYALGALWGYSLTTFHVMGGESNPISLSKKAILVDDPRFNHEPESWYCADAISAADWISNVKSRYGVRDIFMNTSDQGYMQSVYELAFLPRLTSLSDHGADPIMGNYASPIGRAILDMSYSTVLNQGLMWKTYDIWNDDFEGVGFTCGESGYHVNPYTTDLNIMMAAFANTPVDWAAASTNTDSRVKKDSLFKDADAATFNKNYAWNAYNSNAKIEYSKLEDIALAFMEEIGGASVAGETGQKLEPGQSVPYRQSPTNWEAAWRKLGWNTDTADKLAGVDITGSKIYDIDRKFLYGYWKDCFAARQQLFLIFVRAEPMMMGGGSMSKVPPQLGARAVALVWRDPEGPSGAPHRTRVLFYKPLE